MISKTARGLVCGLLPVLAAVCVLAGLCAAQSRSGLNNVGEAEAQGLKLIRQGRIQDAIGTFRQGLESHPRNPYLLNALGASFSLLGKEEEAQQCFRKALGVDPAFLPARKNLAISYFKSRQYNLAEVELQRLSAVSATKPLANMFLGLIAERTKHYHKAVELLDDAGPVTFEEPEGILALTQSYDELHEPQKAHATLAKLSKFPDISTTDRFHAGLLDCEIGEYRAAAQQFALVRQVNPRFAGIEYYQAFAMAKQNDLVRASSLLQRLTTENPHATFLNDLTRFARRSGNYQVALQAIREVTELEPKREQNYLDFSTLCMDSKNYVVALQIVNVGLSRIGASYRLLVQKGALLDKLTEEPQAEEAFRVAIQLQSHNSLAILGLAIAQEHARQFNGAAQTLAAGVRQFPGDARMYYFQGVAFAGLAETQSVKSGDTARAKLAFNRAVRLDPSFADPYCELAKIASTQDPSGAIRLFQQCLSRKPHDYFAEYQLGRLYLRQGNSARSKLLLDAAARDREAKKRDDKLIPHVDATGSEFVTRDASLRKELP